MWSLGISLIELALGRFPFAESSSDDSDLSDFEGTLSPSRPHPALSLTREQKDILNIFDQAGGDDVREDVSTLDALAAPHSLLRLDSC